MVQAHKLDKCVLKLIPTCFAGTHTPNKNTLATLLASASAVPSPLPIPMLTTDPASQGLIT